MLKNLTDFRKTAEAGVDPLLSQKSMLNEVVSICKLLLVNLATSPRRGGGGGFLLGMCGPVLQMILSLSREEQRNCFRTPSR